jgi:hypothetical protein
MAAAETMSGVHGKSALALDRSGGPRRVFLTNPIQITAATGVEGWPTWSPDGRMVAYAADQGGNFDIWVSQIDGAPRSIEHKTTPVPTGCQAGPRTGTRSRSSRRVAAHLPSTS